MNYFSYNRKKYQTSNEEKILDKEIFISTKNVFDTIFEEIISNKNLSSNGIPTKLMGIFNNFIRVIEDDKINASDKVVMIKKIIHQLAKEVMNRFRNKKIINALNELKFNL